MLFAAIRQHDAPEAIVSDGGAVFKATQALEIYQALGIRKEQITRRQSWQSYIETNFNVMRRMADWGFEQATTWTELVAVHDQWVGDFNFQPHWAHRERDDNRHSPVEVLGWVRGTVFNDATLARIFETTRFARHVDPMGYVQFRHWKVYGEYGLAGQTAVLWLSAENLTVTFAGQSLAHYTVTFEADHQRLRTVTDPQIIETTFRSSQQFLWELSDDEWRKIVPPRQNQPLLLWERSPDRWMQIVPTMHEHHRKQRLTNAVQHHLTINT